jgi:penicillin-binding protein 1C
LVSASPPDPPTEEARTPTPPLPAMDAPLEDEAHLPRRVTENDVGATTVTPAAYTPPPKKNGAETGQFERLRNLGGTRGCLIRMAILGLFVLAALLIGIISFGIFQYNSLASTLPPVEDLDQHGAQFETTRILDRQGNLLYEILDPQAGRRTYVPLDDISPYLVAAVIATEDSQYYSHPGYDLWAMLRALWQNFESGEVTSGASTITQQVARNFLFTADERSQVSPQRKAREIMLAAEITRIYTKDQILELYLNQVYFGNMAYGVQAAAETYFGTTASELDLAQASFLAGLIQAPSVYDVYTNREVTLKRHQDVLVLMVQTSLEQSCITVSNANEPVCVTPELAGDASAELFNYEFREPDIQIRFPHWVNYIRAELEARYDPQTIYRSGFTVYTTLDPVLQEQAQDIVRRQVEALAANRATNGALVAIDPGTGEILAMVGSADFYNEAIDGQVNMAVSPRQPGSSFKPLTYAAAFEQGWTPATLIWDVPSEFPPSGDPNDPREPYEPVNYDERFHGPVLVRTALANSYNVPAVKALQFVGIYDNPDTPEEDGLVAFAERMGITTLTRDDYGLSLTLGGGDVSLLELTGAYAIFANGGVRVPPVSILRIESYDGTLVEEYTPPEGDQIISPEIAYLITSILSDNAARTPAFGPNSLLRLPFPAAAKTGTTNDFRDNWTMGYTPDIAVGVWVGNADYTPMQNTSGLSGAAPIWNEFMQIAQQRLTGGQPSVYPRPSGIVEYVICSVSGAEPSEWCPSERTEIFAEDQPPLPSDQDLWREVWVDSFSLELASTDCADFAVEKLGIVVDDEYAREWLQDTGEGQEWAEDMGLDEHNIFFIPDEFCTSDSPRPSVGITSPDQNDVITGDVVQIFGHASATKEFKDWVLEYGLGSNPSNYPDIAHGSSEVNQPGLLAEWDVSNLPNGPVTLRLAVRSRRGGTATVTVRIIIQRPTPTPTMTPTVTMTSTSAPTSTPTLTPTATATPTP